MSCKCCGSESWVCRPGCKAAMVEKPKKKRRVRKSTSHTTQVNLDGKKFTTVRFRITNRVVHYVVDDGEGPSFRHGKY